MADDSGYNTFLSKANEDPSSGSRSDTYNHSTSQARSKYDPSQTQTSSPSIPTPLQNLPDTPFTSDTDSDWTPVFLNYAADTLPSLDQFTQVLRATNGFGEGGAEDQQVEELSVAEFDPRGRYEEIVARVREVGELAGQDDGGKRGKLGGEGVKVFRVQVTRTRVEYYVLTVGERKLVGVVAKAVES